ncbi:type II toxin-antitoxin system HipA family toxin [Herbiconiux sp. VKM Ac-2851]|uniref:type II toxin-antitoxin system HipA family toxin n=1 Tax=Herbiconiux sp. VKM Ac-2851 TaxID=2739025 RepID=UPI001567472A|nr:type II toxin-antitoxin system HipA family toxin [Herbiconiux sp. VKM Ac-2851]NQX35768.1 type II toxin-antitoxin system HipA family toxin [Herbiconiux sp. VKM Ac-2851]
MRILAELDEGGTTRSVGELFSTVRRRTVVSSFGYDRRYLADPSAYAIEPALPLHAGSQALATPLPRAFADAAPDRWGRALIGKRLRAEASAAGEVMGMIDDRDYLLGVSDATRHGALRFRTSPDGPFEHPADTVPKLIALPELMRAAERVARDEPGDLAAVKLLLDAGTGSLGGARPKASVRDGERLLIAKFPHPGDEWDVIAWEGVALELAGKAGIDVPVTQHLELDGRSVLLLERFDRAGTERVGYISAMTMLETSDGEPRDYLEIAEALAAQSARATADLRQLWRRIAFSIALHNTDDHLRNHGFLRARGGWTLSPAFDINPEPVFAAQRVTSVGGASTPDAELRTLLDYAPSFDLDAAGAQGVLREVADAAREWRAVAKRHRIARGELDRFAPTLDATIDLVAAASDRAGGAAAG